MMVLVSVGALFLVGLSAAVTLVTLLNLVTSRHRPLYAVPENAPKVSVLVPARNEADVIERSVGSLMTQDYENLDIWILDDQSTDGTGELVRSLTDLDDRVKVIAGMPVPPGWIGKHWACHQLSQAADGSMLLFTDADTWLAESAVSEAVVIMLNSGDDLVSQVPSRETSSVLQKLTLPFIDWFALGCFPLVLAKRLSSPVVSMAFGQFMLFKRESYEQIGGHEGIKDKIVDDLELGRRIKAYSLRLDLLDGTRGIRCHMYRDNASLIDGFARNIFPSMGSSSLCFAIAWPVVAGVGVAPSLLLAARGLGLVFGGLPLLSSVIILTLMTVSWCLALKRTPHPIWLALAHPVITSAILALGLLSFARVKRQTLSWKGRQLLG